MKRRKDDLLIFFVGLSLEVVGLGKVEKLEAASRGLEEGERSWSFYTTEARVRVEAKVLPE